jgi:hypothetical protein
MAQELLPRLVSSPTIHDILYEAKHETTTHCDDPLMAKPSVDGAFPFGSSSPTLPIARKVYSAAKKASCVTQLVLVDEQDSAAGSLSVQKQNEVVGLTMPLTQH